MNNSKKSPPQLNFFEEIIYFEINPVRAVSQISGPASIRHQVVNRGVYLILFRDLSSAGVFYVLFVVSKGYNKLILITEQLFLNMNEL